jgi:hypothetical protein
MERGRDDFVLGAEVTVVIDRKLKTALDESRLLILGAQVLFGFQFQGAFQDRFADLPFAARAIHGTSALLLLLTVALLIAPSMQHQIAFGGNATNTAVQAATWYAGASLLPFTLGLGASSYVTLSRALGPVMSVSVASVLTIMGLTLLYGIGWVLKFQLGSNRMAPSEKVTPVKAKIEEMLTEARVLIPGAQALLGFQLIAILTKAFGELPPTYQYIHVAGFCSTSVAAMVLMTPAAVHRLAYDGEDDPQFYRIGARLVVFGALPMALGIAADVAVVFYKISADAAVAATAGVSSLLLLISLWYVVPLRVRQARARQTHP